MRISREVALHEVWLDGQMAFAAHSRRKAGRSSFPWRLVACLVLSCAYGARIRADSLRPQLQDVASYLADNSVLPLSQQIDNQLARNILNAQVLASYGGPESLLLSEESVLKAISVYVWPGGPAKVGYEATMPVVWIQSRIAIDPSLVLVLTPSSIDFGQVAVVTPEPSTLVGLIIGLAFVAGFLIRGIKR